MFVNVYISKTSFSYTDIKKLDAVLITVTSTVVGERDSALLNMVHIRMLHKITNNTINPRNGTSN